jgi:hypothetical protein
MLIEIYIEPSCYKFFGAASPQSEILNNMIIEHRGPEVPEYSKTYNIGSPGKVPPDYQKELITPWLSSRSLS